MENEKKEYYRITISDFLTEEGILEKVFAVYENGEFYELLTRKRIYMADSKNLMSKEVLIDDFLNKNCSMIGVKKEPCDEATIGIYLKFTPREEIEKTIKRIEIIEENILKNLEKGFSNSDKMVKKR